jgi:hypothetical protein
MNQINYNYIYINGFWDGFLERTDNSLLVFESILDKTILQNVVVTNDIYKADILLESVFNNSIINKKTWKYKILFVGEPYTFCLPDGKPWYQILHLYNIVFCSSPPFIKLLNIVDMPLFSLNIHCNMNIINNLINKPVIKKVPPHFCCVIVSNPNCKIRNEMFNKLNSYKKVHSFGNYKNNMNYILKSPNGSDE